MESVTYRLTMLRNRPCLSSAAIGHGLLPIVWKCQRHLLVIKWFQWSKNVQFAYSMAVILYRLWFSMVTVIFWWILGLRLNDFNFYVIGKKNLLFLECAFLVLGNRVESSKITSYLELFWTKYFHFGWPNVSTYFSRFVKTDWQIIHKFTDNPLDTQWLRYQSYPMSVCLQS